MSKKNEITLNVLTKYIISSLNKKFYLKADF